RCGHVLHQSARAPDSLATLPQRTSSVFRNAAYASGDFIVIASTPPSTKRALTSGALAALTSAANSLSTTGRGVFGGAMIPNQFTACRLGRPCSAVVGISGRSGLRLSLA